MGIEKRIERLERCVQADHALDAEIADLMQQLPPKVVEQIITEIQRERTHP
jgi:hypothetical protein